MRNRLKILFITEYYPSSDSGDVTGGIEARTYHIASYLAREHEVIVMTSKLPNQKHTQILQGVKVFRVGVVRNYTRIGEWRKRLIFQLSAVWKGLFIDFDVVEGSGFLGYLPAWILGVVHKKKKIILVPDTIENSITDINPFVSKALSIYERWLFRKRWDKIICISKIVVEKLRPFHLTPDTIQVIYCGVDLREIARAKVIESQAPTICCVSRLVLYKKVDDLIRAIGVLKSTLPTIHCEIIGDGEELEKLKELTRHLKLENLVKFHGFLKDHRKVINLVKQAQVFCLPSIVEGFGIVTIEALAAGIPVVIADIPINHEVTQNKGALFFKPGNYVDLANKIRDLISNRPLRKKLVKEAEEIGKQYSWERLGKETYETFKSVYAY